MATNINGVFKIRRATAATLASVVLLDGEIGYATDTKIMKVGDGVTIFSSLSSTTPGVATNSYSGTITLVQTDAIIQSMLNGFKAAGWAPPSIVNSLTGNTITGI